MRLRLLLVAVPLLLAACSDDRQNASDPSDPRCYGIAGVQAWKVDFTFTLNDTGTAVDSFRVALHHHFQGSGTTGALAGYAPDLVNDLQWTAVGATGTFEVHDTVTDLFGDTVRTTTGQGFANMAPVDWARAGGYVGVDLDACQVFFGARPFGRLAHTLNGAAAGVDTAMVGEFEVIQLPFDASAVDSGWSLSAKKVYAVGGYDWMPYGGTYLAYGYSDRYRNGAELDSATVTIKVRPVGGP